MHRIAPCRAVRKQRKAKSPADLQNQKMTETLAENRIWGVILTPFPQEDEPSCQFSDGAFVFFIAIYPWYGPNRLFLLKLAMFGYVQVCLLGATRKIVNF